MNQMKYLLIGCLISSVVSCLPKKNLQTQSDTLNSNDVFQKGFLQIGEDLHEIEYVTDGDEAIFDEHVRVPLNQIHTSPLEGLNLTIEKHVRLWPEGIVPYKKDPALDPFIIELATREFARAGIKLVPHSNQKDWVDIRVVDCVSFERNGKCDNSVHGRGAIGFRPQKDGRNLNQLLLKRESINFKKYDKPGSQKIGSKRFTAYLTLHEMGHVLGCRHEHAHPDAKKFIEPVDKNPKSNPDPYEDQNILSKIGLEQKVAITPFDDRSVMTYPFSYRRKQKCTAASPQPCYPDDLGDYPISLSPRDIEGLKRLYAKEFAKRK